MNQDTVVNLATQAMSLSLKIAGPLLLVALVVGLLVSVFQAVTQIQEQTIVFVPKLVVMVLTIALLAPWLINQMVQYSHDLVASIPSKL